MPMMTVTVDMFEDGMDEIKTLHPYFTDTKRIKSNLFGHIDQMIWYSAANGQALARMLIEGQTILYSLDRQAIDGLTGKINDVN